ncbi:MAG: DUF4886 domain-containing protein [Dysgonamonadaceae bacterium]|jgi:hypothetical protein|nr:DUF4886 domain-containing protein [Dysgonamonadaceae bacterium]
MRNKKVAVWIFMCFCFVSLYAEKVKILAIGNSFSEDAVENYLWNIAKAEEDTLIIGNMYIGGCSLETHWNNAVTNAAAYSYRKINDEGMMTVTESKRLSDAITDEAWDYISFQQVSQNSGMYDTYFPYLPNFLAWVQSLATNPEVEYVLHQTWAYAQTSTHSGFVHYGNNQATMYEAIVNTVFRVATELGITIVIPTGTAIQNARTAYIGDNLCRDGFHLDTGIGRYTAACTWYEKLSGKSVMENTFVPAGLSSRKIALARTAAHHAVSVPQNVTDMHDFYNIPDAGINYAGPTNEIKTAIAPDPLLNTNEIEKVCIYNTQGALVYSDKNPAAFFDKNSRKNSFPEIYVVKLITKNGVQTFKTVKWYV